MINVSIYLLSSSVSNFNKTIIAVSIQYHCYRSIKS